MRVHGPEKGSKYQWPWQKEKQQQQLISLQD
jgi:hypothetical protein